MIIWESFSEKKALMFLLELKEPEGKGGWVSFTVTALRSRRPPTPSGEYSILFYSILSTKTRRPYIELPFTITLHHHSRKRVRMFKELHCLLGHHTITAISACLDKTFIFFLCFTSIHYSNYIPYIYMQI
jgi:hypothetical protein